MISDEDRSHMQRACQLALQGQGRVEPNPLVGCVLVRNGQVLAEGFHQRFGGPHAEREALAQLSNAAARGATAYVTLEPCCHYGKTPPCTNALIEAGVARVCCARLDPFPKVSGGGVTQLQAAGITVDVMSPDDSTAEEVLAPYLKRVSTQLPFVIAKWAMSLDGKMATRTGDSRWISSEASRAHAHQTRGRVDAIIVGSRTAHMDDPLLTARPAGLRTPVRVVVDSQAALKLDSKLVQTANEIPVLVWADQHAPAVRIKALQRAGCRVQTYADSDTRLTELMRFLAAEYQATNVLVEGGGQLLGHLQDQRLIDEYHIYIAPKIIGGQAATTPCGGLGLEQVSQGPTMIVAERLVLGDDQFLRVRAVTRRACVG